MAAFIDDRAKNLHVENGMISFSEWVGAWYYNSYDIMSLILPGMLKYFDLPDLDKWTHKSHKGTEAYLVLKKKGW